MTDPTLGTSEAGGGGAPRALRPEVAMALRLRREMSLPEVLLWQRLKGRQAGLKFRKQHPFGPYAIDFCRLEKRLMIEVDGEGHDRGDRPARDAFLTENGWHVPHIAAARILKDPDAAADAIAAYAARPIHHSPEEANAFELWPAPGRPRSYLGDTISFERPSRAGENL